MTTGHLYTKGSAPDHTENGECDPSFPEHKGGVFIIDRLETTSSAEVTGRSLNKRAVIAEANTLGTANPVPTNKHPLLLYLTTCVSWRRKRCVSDLHTTGTQNLPRLKG